MTLDTGRRQLTRGDEPIDLGKLTYVLLAALVEAAPELLTHDDLVRRVWGGRLTSPETVTQRVKLLRDALNDDAERPRYVGLVRGHGYRLLPAVERVLPAVARVDSAGLAPGSAVPASASAPPAPARRSVNRIGSLLTILVVIAAGILVLNNYLVDPTTRTAETASAAAATDAAATPGTSASVAVLPFVNDSPDPEQQYFADGLSGELINALGRIPGLAIPGRTSSFHFKGKNENLNTIGAALNVEHVLSGAVQKSGDQLRITAELVDVATGRRLWGNTYDRTREDVFAIQDDITEQVAAALQIALGVGRLGRVPGATRNVAAYEEMLRGYGYLREYRADSFQSAIDRFLRATQLDESSSVAWITLANAYAAGSGNLPQHAADWRRRAVEAADRARALTPDALHVLLWDAQRSTDRGAWNEAATFYDEQLNEERFPLLARAYGPNSELWVLKGMFLLQVGRAGEAISHLEHARSADPLNAATARYLGDAYADTDAFSAALAEFDRGLQLESDTAVLQGYALAAALASGDREEIDRRLAALWPSPATDAHVRMARFLDDPAGAVTELRDFVAMEPAAPDLLTALVLAHWAGYYGDAPTALALLRRIPRQLFTGDIALALWRPVFSDVRRLPEFNDLVRELGLVDYWRSHGWSDFCRPVGDRFACA